MDGRRQPRRREGPVNTYEYICGDCPHKWDATYQMPGPEHPPCPQCGSENTGKVISAPTVVLRGDGWTTRKTDAEQDAEEDATP